MAQFLVDIWLDGYDSDEEMEAAAVEFLDDQLNFCGSSVKITQVTKVADIPSPSCMEAIGIELKKLVDSRRDK